VGSSERQVLGLNGTFFHTVDLAHLAQQTTAWNVADCTILKRKTAKFTIYRDYKGVQEAQKGVWGSCSRRSYRYITTCTDATYRPPITSFKGGGNICHTCKKTGRLSTLQKKSLENSTLQSVLVVLEPYWGVVRRVFNVRNATRRDVRLTLSLMWTVFFFVKWWFLLYSSVASNYPFPLVSFHLCLVVTCLLTDSWPTVLDYDTYTVVLWSAHR
jgi:hypothetical protein